jgi:iron-sulfur cluster repair protein YtfE (RIC family)
MNADDIRRRLLAQHDQLRKHVETCTRLAKLERCGDDVTRELDAVLAALREDFGAHNQAETVAIRTLLHGPSAWSSLLIDRMLEEHVAEHAAFWELLCGPRAELSVRIDELADELEAHMAAEERTFLAPTTLRDNVIRARTREESAE